MVANQLFESLLLCLIHKNNNSQDWFCKRKVSAKYLSIKFKGHFFVIKKTLGKLLVDYGEICQVCQVLLIDSLIYAEQDLYQGGIVT